MLIRVSILFYCLMVLSGCAQTSIVMNDRAPQYPPTTIVDILYQKPDREFTEIGLMETRLSAPNTSLSLPDLIENMKEKAKAVGADAIILINTHNEQSPQNLIYNSYLGGYQTVGGHSMPVVMGMAIKYVQ